MGTKKTSGRRCSKRIGGLSETMKKVYALTYEDYEEFYIIGIFTSKMRAKKEKEWFKKPNRHASTRIYVCELNTPNVTEL